MMFQQKDNSAECYLNELYKNIIVKFKNSGNQ